MGLVLALAGAAAVYFIGYRGMTIDEARTRLAQLLKLPGLTPPPSTAAGSSPAAQGAA